MKRIAYIAGLATGLGLLLSAAVRADDTVVRRDKSGKDAILTGTIVDETPAGVKIKVGKEVQLVPPEDVVEVGYQAPGVSDIEFRTPHGKEADALGKTGDERKKGLAEALTLYQALLPRVKATPNAERFVQFRIAMMAVEQAKDDPTKSAAAVAALNGYRKTYPGGWEIVPATKTAAELLEAAGNLDGARQAYEDLANSKDAPKDVQLSTNLLVSRMLVRERKYADAEQKLKAVLAGSTDEKQRSYVQVYLAQTQVAQGNVKEAEAPLRAAIQTAGDDSLRALAFNALGDFYQQSKQPEEAFWQYLRVDVLYSQDREEHARALYNLWKLFDSVRSDPQRAKDCLDRLKDKSLAGTEYQARVQKETEGDKKNP